MPNWNSIGGKWFPAKEYAVNPHLTYEDHKKGVSPVYEGPDRAALEELKQAGVEHLGKDYHLDPDLIRQSRELGYKSVDTFLREMYGVDAPELVKKQEESQANRVVDHKNPPAKNPVREVGGGDDRSGKSPTQYGGFDDPKGVSGSELKKRA